jgi:hypothetical protein
MEMARYRHQDENRTLVFPLLETKKVLNMHRQEYGSEPYIEPLPTMITARYLFRGRDADEALSDHLDGAIDDFIAGINFIVGAHLINISGQGTGILVPVYDRGLFPWICIFVRGKNKQFNGGRVAINLLRTQLVPDQYPEGGWQSFLAHLSGEQRPDISVKALRTAQSYIHVGVYEFALLLLSIAVEVATSRFVYATQVANGISPKKDPTFSDMLHKQLLLLCCKASPRLRRPTAPATRQPL